MCREQQVTFYPQFYQVLRLCFDFIISIFLLRAWRLHSWEAHTQTQMHALQITHKDHLPFSDTNTITKFKKCDSSALSLVPVGAKGPLLCTCATEIDKQAEPPVCPEGVSVVQYVLSQSSKLFFSPLLPPLPPPPPPPPLASAVLQNENSEWSDMWTASH